jgi:hypothetical protein
MAGAKDPLAVGQQLLVQPQRPAASPRRHVKPAMLFRVVRVPGWLGPRTRSWSGSSSWNSRSAPAASPHCPVKPAMLFRVRRVSGWRGPRNRSRSGSSSWDSRSAPATSPHCPVQ